MRSIVDADASGINWENLSANISGDLMHRQNLSAGVGQHAHSSLLAALNRAVSTRRLVLASAEVSELGHLLGKIAFSLILIAISYLLVRWVNGLKPSLQKGQEEPHDIAASSHTDTATSDSGPASARSKASDAHTEDATSLCVYGALCRVTDKAALAEVDRTDDALFKDKILDATRKMLTAASHKNSKLKPGKTGKLSIATHDFYYNLDSAAEFIIFLVAAPGVSEKKAHEWIRDVQKHGKEPYIQELRSCPDSGPGKETQKELTDVLSGQISGPRTSILGKQFQKMEALKTIVTDNMEKVKSSQCSAISLAGRTKKLDLAAQNLKQTAKVTEWKHILTRYKRYAVVCIFVLDVIVLFVVWKFC